MKEIEDITGYDILQTRKVPNMGLRHTAIQFYHNINQHLSTLAVGKAFGIHHSTVLNSYRFDLNFAGNKYYKDVYNQLCSRLLKVRNLT